MSDAAQRDYDELLVDLLADELSSWDLHNELERSVNMESVWDQAGKQEEFWDVLQETTSV